MSQYYQSTFKEYVWEFKGVRLLYSKRLIFNESDSLALRNSLFL